VKKISRIIVGALLLVISLLLIFTSGLTGANAANPIRVLPKQVYPGQTFQVVVTFTSPAAKFNAIGLADVAPAGWGVSVDMSWCNPIADVDWVPPKTSEMYYIWFGDYDANVKFRAVYKVQVPVNTSPGVYKFSGILAYYVAAKGVYIESIIGNSQVEVISPVKAKRQSWQR
jgi:hypothetical protein